MASAILLIPFYMPALSTADFGALSIYLAYSLLMQILVTYSFDASLYIHYHEYKDDAKKLATYISSAFLFMLFIGGGLSILFSIIGDAIFTWVLGDGHLSFYPYGYLALFGGIFQALIKVHSNLLQTREKPETFFWSNLFLFSGIATFTILGLHYYPQTLLGPLGGRLLALLLVALWVLYRIFGSYGIKFNFQLLTASFSFNFYAFVYQLQQWLINYFDRVLMLFFIPLSAVGVYDFAIKALIAIEFLMNGLHSSFFPKVVKEVMSQTIKSTSVIINRYYHGLVAVVMLLVSGSILIVPFLIEWLADHFNKPDYKEAVALVPFIAVLYLLRVIRTYFGFPYSILKYTKPLPVMYAVTTAIKLVGIVLVAKEYGLVGVIVVSMLSMVVEILLLKFQIKTKFRFDFNMFKIAVAPLLLLLVILLAEVGLPSVMEQWLHVSYFVLCVIILILVYRNEVKSLNPFKLLK